MSNSGKFGHLARFRRLPGNKRASGCERWAPWFVYPNRWRSFDLRSVCVLDDGFDGLWKETWSLSGNCLLLLTAVLVFWGAMLFLWLGW